MANFAAYNLPLWPRLGWFHELSFVKHKKNRENTSYFLFRRRDYDTLTASVV
jgi:hypothetical protein